MKIITLQVQIKIDEENLSSSQNAEDILDDLLACVETPIEDDDGPLDHLKKYGYESMIMNRSDK